MIQRNSHNQIGNSLSPAVEDASVTIVPRGQRDPAVSVALKILVVDDNYDAAEALGEIMEDLGHQVTVVFGGADALKVSAGTSHDLMLLDIGMPGLDGYETVMQLRSRNATPRPFVVALTGFDQPSDRKRALDAGFDRHMAKPVNLALLEELIVFVEQQVAQRPN